MRSKSQPSVPKKINFIEKNRQNILARSVKQQNPKATQVRSLSTSMPEIAPGRNSKQKSKIPAVSPKASVPEEPQSQTVWPSALVEEYDMHPRTSLSDTDCPPTPPRYPLEVVPRVSVEEFNLHPKSPSPSSGAEAEAECPPTTPESLLEAVTSVLEEECSGIPNTSFSDTEGPPCPTGGMLEEIKESAGEESQEVKEYRDAETQTEKKLFARQIEYKLRRSERLAKIKERKRKSSFSDCNVKELKLT